LALKLSSECPLIMYACLVVQFKVSVKLGGASI